MVKEMAEKNSFVVYTDIAETLEELEDAQVAALFRGMVKYQQTGEDPKFRGTLKYVFIPIRQQMDRDNEKWSKTKEARSAAGRKGGKQTQAKQANACFVKQIKQKQANQAVNVNVNDNVNVNVNGNVNVADRMAAETTSSVISYLNEKSGGHYEATDTNTEQVRGLLAKGYTEADIRSVIDKKCAEWGGSDRMRPYLRPSTLFGDKFDEYLSAPLAGQAAAERDEAERKERARKAKEEQAAREAALEAEYEAGQKRLSPEEVQARLAAISKKTFN